MIDRRAHLKSLLGLMAGATATSSLLSACGKKNEALRPAAESAPSQATPAPAVIQPFRVGAQMFAVRELLKKDPRGTLEALAKIGFKEVELFGFGGQSIFLKDPLFGLKPAEFRKVIDDLGLTVPTVHFTAEEAVVPQVAEVALQLGAHHLIQAMSSEFLQMTSERAVITGITGADQMQRVADSCNRLGVACKKHGIGFAYHNHHMELAPLGSGRAYDILLAKTDPSLVRMELDVGWAAVAGVDPAEILDRTPERFIACHLKDFNPKLPRAKDSATAPMPEQTQLVPPGEGILDFPRLLAAMQRAGVKHGYVEVDLPLGDPMDNCARGYKYLESLQTA